MCSTARRADAQMTAATFARVVRARQAVIVAQRADDAQTDACPCPRGRCPACHESARQVELVKQRLDDEAAAYRGWLAVRWVA